MERRYARALRLTEQYYAPDYVIDNSLGAIEGLLDQSQLSPEEKMRLVRGIGTGTGTELLAAATKISADLEGTDEILNRVSQLEPIAEAE